MVVTISGVAVVDEVVSMPLVVDVVMIVLMQSVWTCQLIRTRLKSGRKRAQCDKKRI